MFQPCKGIADETDRNARELLNLKHCECRTPLAEALDDVPHHEKCYLSAVRLTDILGTDHVFIIVEILVHIAQFGAEQTDIPRYLHPQHEQG